jgi:hypothetical protein
LRIFTGNDQTIIDYIIYKIYNKFMQRNSNLIFRGILHTPPIRTDPKSDVVLFTVLDRRNYRAYLLAAKSFLRYCGETEGLRVVVQSDETLDAQCVRDLEAHLPGLVVLDAGESRCIITERASPRLLELLPPFEQCHFFLVYKLLSVIYRFPGKKVILFDSDLLFLREPVFVTDWIRDGSHTCFHSDGGNSLAAAFREMGFDFSKVDINCFNAGFIGLHNRLDEGLLMDVVGRIRKHDPRLFTDWEIEQAMWAVLFNHFENPVNLDHIIKDYVASGWWTYDRIRARSVLVHFVGSIRFKNFRYLRLARQVIGELRAQAPPILHTQSPVELDGPCSLMS